MHVSPTVWCVSVDARRVVVRTVTMRMPRHASDATWRGPVCRVVRVNPRPWGRAAAAELRFRELTLDVKAQLFITSKNSTRISRCAVACVARGAPRGGATGVGVEGSPGPEPRDGDAGERLRHVTINRGAGGHGLAR